MTADTFSNTLGFLAMVTGNDNNSWGNNANTAVFQIFEDAIANALTSAVTGGTLDLSGSPPPNAASQVRYAALIFTGTLASGQTVKVPNLTKWWWVNNQTSGAFTLKLQATGGSVSTAIPQNSGWQLVQCDGATNIVVSPFNSAQIQMPDGTLALPSHSFLNETGSGLRRAGTQDVRIVINGVDIIQVTGSGAGTPSVVNVLAGTLQQGGVAVATGSAVTAVATPTTNHIAQWASATTIKDGGVLGSLAALSSVTAAQLDSGGSTLDQWAISNLSIAATVGSNLLTVTLNGANGSTPSASNPVLVNFQDSSGNPVLVSVQAATSIVTHATGNTGDTLGSVNNVPFRIWVVLFNNAGTAVLGLINASTSTQIFPVPEYGTASSTPFATGTSAGVFYTQNGTTLSNKQYRIIGCLNYETALATAGTYNNAPDTVRLLTPGSKRPGDVIQTVTAQITSNTSCGTSNTQTGVTASITPSSKINLVACRANVVITDGAVNALVQWSRGTSPTLIGTASCSGGGGISAGGLAINVPVVAYDLPGTTSAQAYYIFGKSSSSTVNVGGGTIFTGAIAGSTVELTELMG